jgi:uncharacterized alpha-E superfamily protein
MLSRVADSVYWMSRYVERAENVARFIDVNFQLMLDEAGGEDRPMATPRQHHLAMMKSSRNAIMQRPRRTSFSF